MIKKILGISCVLAQLPHFAYAAMDYPIAFVTQVPIHQDFCTINATFCNHQAAINVTGRGGDLWIRYPDGSLKNLTEAAGYGMSGHQGANAIQVRDPSVSWDGNKIIFSMVVGAPSQYQVKQYFWQLYEVTGLGKNETPVITKVAYQPTTFNNVSPIYGTDGRIIFVSDRTRGGLAHLYPQRDEYEEQPTNTGLWSLDPVAGNIFIVTHAPSGDFNPMIDSYGRVVFTRWDHLQQDQQAEADRNDPVAHYGTFNYASEATNAAVLNTNKEVFPEPLSFDTPALAGTNLNGHRFNHFFPWQVNEDGTELELVNHVGRHELGGSYVDPVFNDDPNLTYVTTSVNQNKIGNFFQIKQNPVTPSQFFGVDAPEFGTHASGQLLRLNNAAPTQNAYNATITYITDPSSGHYRDPLMLSDGTLLATHTPETLEDQGNASSSYAFRIYTLKKPAVGKWVIDQPLTSGISKNINYFDPSTKITYNGLLWELQPVEVKARIKPAKRVATLGTPELQVLQEEGVTESQLRNYLLTNNLALGVVRNVTRRDSSDKQQPFNLAVAGSATQTSTGVGKLYEVAYFQAFQADQIRGIKGYDSPNILPGRRVLAQPMHGTKANPPQAADAPVGSVKIANDGSVAMLLPVRRALSWQITDSTGQFVVRERNWLSMQPGEIRTCPACHGVNKTDQVGKGSPGNKPQALRQLVRYLKSIGSL
ncbi:hypothetical protein JCM14076_05320 [Methylosoma difficile]